MKEKMTSAANASILDSIMNFYQEIVVDFLDEQINDANKLKQLCLDDKKFLHLLYENTEIKKVCDEAEDKLITTLYKKVVKKD